MEQLRRLPPGRHAKLDHGQASARRPTWPAMDCARRNAARKHARLLNGKSFETPLPHVTAPLVVAMIAPHVRG